MISEFGFRVTYFSGMLLLDVIVLWLLWVNGLFLGRPLSVYAFGLFDLLLATRMFVKGPVFGLMLSTTIDNLFTTAALACGTL